MTVMKILMNESIPRFIYVYIKHPHCMVPMLWFNPLQKTMVSRCLIWTSDGHLGFGWDPFRSPTWGECHNEGDGMNQEQHVPQDLVLWFGKRVHPPHPLDKDINHSTKHVLHFVTANLNTSTIFLIILSLSVSLWSWSMELVSLVRKWHKHPITSQLLLVPNHLLTNGFLVVNSCSWLQLFATGYGPLTNQSVW